MRPGSTIAVAAVLLLGALASAGVDGASVTPSVAGPVADALSGRGEAEIRGGAAGGQRFLVSAMNCGDRLATEWRRPDGTLAAVEEIEVADGRWVRYRLQRANLGQDLRAERNGAAVTIVDGSRPTRPATRLTERGLLLAGPELITFLRSQLPALRQGRALEFRYLLADRGIALGFVARAAADGEGTLVTLEAASAFARPFVPVTRLGFAADGSLRQVVGRMLPMSGDPRSPTALDGVLRMSAAKSTCNTKSLS